MRVVGTTSFAWSDLDGFMVSSTGVSWPEDVSLEPLRAAPGRSSREARLAPDERVGAVSRDVAAAMVEAVETCSMGILRRDGGIT
jgi:hypothetical protein